jgi:hypothetical protein
MSPTREFPGGGWTTVPELVTVLRKRWDRGQYLQSHAAGQPWQPIALPVRAPAAGELLERLDEAKLWLQTFQRQCRSRGGQVRLRIEYKTVAGRGVGRNELPRRVWVDSFDDLVSLLGVAAQLSELDALLGRTEATVPQLRDWVVRHPHRTLALSAVWDRLLATTASIRDHETPHLYVRQIDVAGVDTKFVETYHLELAELLEHVLPPERVDRRFDRSHFDGRFGFRRRPDYTRVRFLGGATIFPPALSEVSLRAEEFADLDPGCSTVVMVENEITYLALPAMADTLAIFGSGFALGSVAGFVWLQHKRIVYWGDIDTHGFVILNRLRARYPRVESVLMDHRTLLDHLPQWVEEPAPSRAALPHLSEAESELYRDLVEDSFGHHVRLEQERVRFSRVAEQLAVATSGPVR